MPRRARIIFPGLPHHVTQRGARRQTVFFTHGDRLLYLRLLKSGIDKYQVPLLAYCLMSNHVHLVLIPSDKNSFQFLFKELHSQYAAIINRREGWSGHLWQSRYFSCALDENHFYSAVRYVELNPVRAGIVSQAGDYLWSSTNARLNGKSDDLLSFDNEWNKHLPGQREWEEYLSDNTDGRVETIRRNLSQNLPCGDRSFISDLEALAGCSLTFRSRGRPVRGKSDRPL